MSKLQVSVLHRNVARCMAFHAPVVVNRCRAGAARFLAWQGQPPQLLVGSFQGCMLAAGLRWAVRPHVPGRLSGRASAGAAGPRRGQLLTSVGRPDDRRSHRRRRRRHARHGGRRGRRLYLHLVRGWTTNRRRWGRCCRRRSTTHGSQWRTGGGGAAAAAWADGGGSGRRRRRGSRGRGRSGAGQLPCGPSAAAHHLAAVGQRWVCVRSPVVPAAAGQRRQLEAVVGPNRLVLHNGVAQCALMTLWSTLGSRALSVLLRANSPGPRQCRSA